MRTESISRNLCLNDLQENSLRKSFSNLQAIDEEVEVERISFFENGCMEEISCFIVLPSFIQQTESSKETEVPF